MASINKRLCAALTQMQNPVKDTSAYKYKYAQLDQVLAIVQKALTAQGLAVVQRSACIDGQWRLATVLIDAEAETLESGQVTLDERALVDSPDAQVKGSYETYMRRYALLTAFGLAAEDDDGAITAPRAYNAPQAPKYAKPNTSTNQMPKAAQIGSQSVSGAYKELYTTIGEYKKACLEQGISEDGIRAWMQSAIGKPMKDMNEGELKQVLEYLKNQFETITQMASQKEA